MKYLGSVAAMVLGPTLLLFGLILGGCLTTHTQEFVSRVEFPQDGVVCYLSRGGSSYISCVKTR